MRLVLLSLILVLFACESSSDSSEVKMGTASYKINGVEVVSNWNLALKPSGENNEFQILIREKVDGTTTTNLVITGIASSTDWAGAYSNNDNETEGPETYGLYRDYTTGGLALYTWGDGGFVISAVTDEKVTGTFSFKVASANGLTIKTITDGKFDVYFE